MTAADEQRALYEELCESVLSRKSTVHQRQDWELVERLNTDGTDQRAMFRSMLAGVDLIDSLEGVVYLHRMLEERGTTNVHELINDETLGVIEAIDDALDHLMSEDELTNPIMDMMHYAVTSDDREWVTKVIEERKPNDLTQLVAIIDEIRRVTTPLQNGVL